MGLLNRLRAWQKGLIFGLGFTSILSVIFTIILIFLDLKLASQGLPHLCFAFSENVVCTLSQAIYSRIGFMFVLVLVFGLPAGIFGMLIGILVENIKIS